MNIIEQAVEDAKKIRETAYIAAKNEILTSMTPQLRSLVKNSVLQNEGVNRIRRGTEDNCPGESHTGFEEGKNMDEKELDLESITSFFPSINEEEEDEDKEEEMDEVVIPVLGEGEEEEKEDEDEDKEEEMDEAKKDDNDDDDVEISESELKQVYESALQTEISLSKGFKEMTASGELEDVIKDVDKGILDVKKGDKQWSEETPPSKQDYTMKEVKTLLKKGLAENKCLRENLGKAISIIRQLGTKLHEVNLFNSKVMHVNKFLNSHSHNKLTNEQRKAIFDAMDSASSIKEVKTVYNVINSSFKASATLSESRKPLANAQRARTTGAASKQLKNQILSESAGSSGFTRLQQLAGLLK